MSKTRLQILALCLGLWVGLVFLVYLFGGIAALIPTASLSLGSILLFVVAPFRNDR